MEAPIVSVIAICYNQAAFLEEALWSVVGQTFRPIELLIVDNASQDNSKVRIIEWMEEYYHSCAKQGLKPISIRTFFFEQNKGNCRAFNEVLRWAKGKYIIDFSLDDVMLAEHIERHVDLLEQKGYAVGISFSNAWYIDASGKVLKNHYPTDKSGCARLKVPQGEVLHMVLRTAYICTPTLVMRAPLLRALGGYDESLVYEDFDFLIRAASRTHFAYLDACTMMKRLHRASQSEAFYQPAPNAYLRSTFLVSQKALHLCRCSEEYAALATRTFYHWRLAHYVGDRVAANQFRQLLTSPLLSPHLPVCWPILDRLMPLCYLRPFYVFYRRLRQWLVQRF